MKYKLNEMNGEKYLVRVLNKEYWIFIDGAGLDVEPVEPEPFEGLGMYLFNAVFDYFELVSGKTVLLKALRELNIEVLDGQIAL